MIDAGTERIPVSQRRLWFGVLIAPAAWIIALIVGYLLVSRGCDIAPNGLRGRPVASPGVVQVVFGVAFTVLALGSLWAARGSYRAIVASRPPGQSTRVEWDRARFMALVGILVASIFAFGIALIAIAPLMLNACMQAH
ncbi:MAG TPA: hypothetical protein VGH98_12030 [Gemmatimonadaceae bacterium]|jgi:hypothetical protein